MSNPSPLFYEKIVALNANTHKGYYLEPATNFKFAQNTNSTYIAHVEFLKASREYPIVFAKDNNNSVYPVVLLGLGKDQNLFVDKKGNWLGNYIPAYVRRYPFILASTTENDANLTICIDETYSGFNKNKKGEKLFDSNSSHSDFLKNSIEFLREFNKHTQVTTAFCQSLNNLNILEPMKLSMKTNDGREVSMGGFMGVNRSKFKELPANQVYELFKTDQLELIYLHLASLSNVEALMNRLE